MLAASADRNSALGLFQLVLRSVDKNPAVEISDELKRHVVEVLISALQIAADPRKVGPETPAEAIELALRLRGHGELTDKISRVRAFDNIHADLARELLKSLQAVAA
jgi:hypothetical protein